MHPGYYQDYCLLTLAQSKNILSIIPARGGSKGIPGKNIKLLNGMPLLEYTARSSLESSYITRSVLTTDSHIIADLGRSLGLEVPFIRPSSLALDDTPSLPVFQHLLVHLYKSEAYLPDLVVILQPTSPLRTSAHIDSAIELYCSSSASSLVSVRKVPHAMTPSSLMSIRDDGFIYHESTTLTLSRQHKPTFYARNGAAIYISTYHSIVHHNNLLDEPILPFIMSSSDSVDIDDPDDWTLAERLLASR